MSDDDVSEDGGAGQDDVQVWAPAVFGAESLQLFACDCSSVVCVVEHLRNCRTMPSIVFITSKMPSTLIALFTHSWMVCAAQDENSRKRNFGVRSL